MAVAAIFFLLDPFPTQGAEEAELIDDAFFVLTYMATPVFGLVIAALLYSVLRFRSRGEPTEDGPAIFGRGAVPWVWLVATSALTVVVMIYPGLIGLADLRSDEHADLRIGVVGVQWDWLITYPEQNITLTANGGDELVLPAETRIQFDIEAARVLHSFWIPAFRTKVDAVPGQTETLYITTTGVGEPDDAAYRVQCAELCGLRHWEMSMPVRVVSQAEFEDWVASRTQSAAIAR